MSLPLILGCFWVIASAVVAMLPMRLQMIPGLVLLVLAPVLILWIGMTHGWLWLTVAIFAFGSMFRRPLVYFTRKALGFPVTDPRVVAGTPAAAASPVTAEPAE